MKFVILSFVCVLSALMLSACEREQRVQAGSERSNTGTYQPRPAPPENSGELQRVDTAAKTISIRVDDGVEQTFKFNSDTIVEGLEDPAKTTDSSNAAVRNLMGKEGSEVTVQWRNDDASKMATHIGVTQLSTARSSRHTGKGKTK